MQKFKSLLAKYFESFAYFYRRIGYRLFVAMVLSVAVGILDGFGLAMFLPLLQMVNEEGQASEEGMGNLGFLIESFEVFGLPLNILTVLLFLSLFFTFKGVAKFFSAAYQVKIRQLFLSRVRLSLLNSFNRMAFKHFIQTDVGRIQNTMTTEADRIMRAIVTYLRAMEQFVLVVVYVAFAFFVDARFALLVTVGGLLTNFLYKLIFARTKKVSRSLSRNSDLYQGLIIQHVYNFKYLKATSSVGVFSDKLKNSIDRIENDNRKIGMLNSLVQSVREPLMIYVVSGVILLQVLVLGSSLAPILISLLFFYRALTALMNMQNSWNGFLSMSGSMNNISLLQRDMDAHKEKNGRRKISTFTKLISLRDVCLAYEDTRILKDVDLEIERNTTVAFVGESGSGKTSLVNVITGLLPLSGGDLKVDGISRDELDLRSFQKRIGYITQEPVIFNDTIFNNVTFWAQPTEENKQRFREALKKAAIAKFVSELPDGADTVLGNNGINLSGGQKQRISIARELYKEIDILVMDEATSALDTETEKTIQDSIDALKGSYTIIVVAHRLSTIKNADKVVLMKAGEIQAVGGFGDLFRTDKDFKRMVQLQEV